MTTLNCDSKTENVLFDQLSKIIEDYKDLLDNNQFDEMYEKLNADENIAGIMVSRLTILNDEVLGKSWMLSLHNIPDFFLTNTDIQNFTVPDGVQIIGKDAFSYCKDLVTISIPKSLKTIKENAFNCCPNLKTIYYRGTPNDADAVDIKNGNDSFRSANVQIIN